MGTSQIAPKPVEAVDRLRSPARLKLTRPTDKQNARSAERCYLLFVYLSFVLLGKIRVNFYCLRNFIVAVSLVCSQRVRGRDAVVDLFRARANPVSGQYFRPKTVLDACPAQNIGKSAIHWESSRVADCAMSSSVLINCVQLKIPTSSLSHSVHIVEFGAAPAPPPTGSAFKFIFR